MEYGKIGGTGTLVFTGAGFLGYWYVGAGIVLLTLAVIVFRHKTRRIRG